MTTGKYVWAFSEGNKDQKQLLGGKGANLCEMTRIGLPVPPGFILSTDACQKFYDDGKRLGDDVRAQTMEKLEELQKATGLVLGSIEKPLLLSVRSGAAVSMPGMMDTVLNLGLNDETVLTMGQSNERFAWDSYRRLIQMFGNVVKSLDASIFEHALEDMKSAKSLKFDHQLSAEDLKTLVATYKRLYLKHTGTEFPQDPIQQLFESINAVFGSWNNKRAIAYRRINHITGLRGTAVNVQTMVYGNMGDTSGSGVCFTRNPSTGENKFYGEYLFNAQGEDVVSGVRTPVPLDDLNSQMPSLYEELCGYREKLEKHYKDMQDMEFTIQESKLYILQTRNGKRTAPAALRMAIEMVAEGLIDEKTAILRVDPSALGQLLHKRLDPAEVKKATPLTSGLPASPGAGVGRIVFEADVAKDWASKGVPVVLVRQETSAEDIEGMHASVGIITSHGGMTSHAAVVARERGVPCVAGCSDITIRSASKSLTTKTGKLAEGDWITLDGTSGKVYTGQMKVVDPEVTDDFEKLMDMANHYAKLKVLCNADTPLDARIGKGYGAQGIGLVRTEHMYFESKRILALRKMILAENDEDREHALTQLLPFQRDDFMAILKEMNGLPVVIRLLDPPLHEFLPKEPFLQRELAAELGVELSTVQAAVAALSEVNPMLGFRGCRLGMVYPSINSMQCQAVFEAALALKAEGGDPRPCIEVPLVVCAAEMIRIKGIVDDAAEKTGAKGKVQYEVGTMIETPRAAFMAATLAPHVDFMSFGTNDLTQLTLGFSRDDAASFLAPYLEQGVFDRDPFQSIEQEGVGELMRHCVNEARRVKPDLKIGICGEHGGDPKSVEFCHQLGLTDVSCSPFRVPTARLAAAQAMLKSM